jgi:hypothetical protein
MYPSIKRAAVGKMKNKIIVVIQIMLIIAAGHFLAYQICHVPKQIKFVVFFAIALAYPIVRFPIFGIYAYFLVSPFIPYIRRLYYLAYGRPGTDPLIVIGEVILFLVFVGLFFEFRQRGPSDSLSRFFRTMIVLYFIYLVIRTFVFNIYPPSENVMKLKYYAPTVLLFFIGMHYEREEAQVKRLWILTIIIGCVACFYGLKQLYVGYSSAEKLWFSSISFSTLFIKGIARPFSFFQSPASFADFLLLSIIGVLVFHIGAAFKGKRLLLALIPLLFYGILVTSVRSNWIGAAAALICWFVVFQMKNNGQRIAVIAAAAVFFLLFQFVGDSMNAGPGLANISDLTTGNKGKHEYIDLMVTSRARAITNPFEEHSMLSRLALWKYMFLLSVDPELAILGRGLGTLNADSLYVTYLAEFGYPGFFFMIGLFGAFIIIGLRVIDGLHNEERSLIAKGVVCMDLALALMNITGTHIHSFPGDAYFWFFNGVLISMAARFNKTSEEVPQP